MRATPQMITSAMQLYFNNNSIVLKCSEISEVARRENDSCCNLQMDKEIRGFNEIVFRENNTKCF